MGSGLCWRAGRGSGVIFYPSLTQAQEAFFGESSQVAIRQTIALAVLAAAMALAATTAHGATVPGLYEAEVPWEGDREAAFADALGVVLVRMTGRRDAASMPGVQPLLAAAPRYAQQFRNPTPDTLWVAFDGEALSRALAEAGQPLWGRERPGTLVWLAVDAGGGRRFVVASEPEVETESALQARLEAAARRRGIPLVFPLMDAEDRGRASFPEVWGGFDDAIRDASARYGADAIVVGRLAAGDFDRGRWTLYAGEETERWVGGIEDSLDRVADAFAARFAVVPSGAGAAVTLVVKGVGSVEDYGRVTRFLGNLTAVQRLGVERIEGNTIVMRAMLLGDEAQFDRAVRLGGILEAADGAGLVYRVRR